MPRIRTLKPEHRQHRKIGPMDHVTYRLWVGMILEADDEGRLVCDAEQLRVTIFGYHPKVRRPVVEGSLRALEASGLLRLYAVGGARYAWFPSWHDHQKIDKKQPSKLPPYDDSTNGSRTVDERSSLIGSDLDLKGSEGIGNTSPRAEEVWPSPEALVALYNTQCPDECPAVTRLSPRRRKKAQAVLTAFPDQAFWEETFAQVRASRFLRGLRPSSGHETFVADFDWLLSNGKDGSENAVKVHDGRYLDG